MQDVFFAWYCRSVCTSRDALGSAAVVTVCCACVQCMAEAVGGCAAVVNLLFSSNVAVTPVAMAAYASVQH
jgi:hypothetical protein